MNQRTARSIALLQVAMWMADLVQTIDPDSWPNTTEAERILLEREINKIADRHYTMGANLGGSDAWRFARGFS